MKNDKIIIKFKNISYLGDSVGDDINVEIKIRDQVFTFNPPLKLNSALDLNSEIFQFDFTLDKFEENINIKVTEKDILFDDIGRINQKISIDLSKNELQEFVFEIKVKELGTNLRPVTAIFKIVLIFEKASYEQKQIIISKIREQAKIHDLDPDFVVALAFCESSFNPLAVSKTGAKGIFQLTGIARAQLKKLDFSIGDNELFDIDKNIIGGIIYLAWVWKRYKGKQDQYEKLIAAWNAGRSYIPLNGPVTFNNIPKPKKREEVKQLIACVMSNWKKKNE
ncbi:MAG: transglycosylase SLT domain-containing protein [bacterium]